MGKGLIPPKDRSLWQKLSWRMVYLIRMIGLYSRSVIFSRLMLCWQSMVSFVYGLTIIPFTVRLRAAHEYEVSCWVIHRSYGADYWGKRIEYSTTISDMRRHLATPLGTKPVNESTVYYQESFHTYEKAHSKMMVCIWVNTVHLALKFWKDIPPKKGDSYVET